MSTKITNLTNKAGETVGTVSFDESAHSWRIALKLSRISGARFRGRRRHFISGIPGSTRRPVSCGAFLRSNAG
jgi:hypothetical protein